MLKSQRFPHSSPAAERNIHFAAQDGKVLLKRLGPNRVFDEEGSQIFNRVATANGVRQIEALMEIDAPVAILPYALSHLGAFFAHVVNPLPGVVGAVRRRLRGTEPEGAIAGLYGEPGAILEAGFMGYSGNDAGRVIALDSSYEPCPPIADGQADPALCP